MTLANDLKQQIDQRSLTTGCRRRGCSLSLKGIQGKWTLVDLDSPWAPISQTATRCDFLFVGAARQNGPDFVAPIELKRGDVNASEVITQLRAGALLAEAYISAKTAVEFVPILASGRLHKAQHNQLRRQSSRISFGNRQAFVQRIQCGDLIARALAR